MAKAGDGTGGKAGGAKRGAAKRTPAAPRRNAKPKRTSPEVAPGGAGKPRAKVPAKAPTKTPATPKAKKAAPKSRKPAASVDAPARPPKPKRSWRRKLLRAGVLLSIWGFLIVGAVVGYLYITLPSLEGATKLKRGPTAALLARDGAFIASYGELRGEMATVAALPSHLPRAVIAIEDRRFYEHGGIDPRGVARAIFVNVTSGRLRQGASTITQQLARNLLLSQRRTFGRKAREALLALELERRFAKDQILTIYLNRVYFGGGAYGVDAAARRFFGKPAVEVNLWEAALLAGSLKAPSKLAPDRNPEGAAARARLVLNAMVDMGFITAAAANEPLAVVASASTALTSPVAGNARYFADWALDQTDGFMAGLEQDVLVQTTLDLELQRLAEWAVQDGLASKPTKTPAAKWPGQAALIAMTPDGAVRAMVGGRSYVESQFNRVTQARRQLGSSFKPFVYLAALEAGMEPDDIVLDAPITVGKWRPRNYKDRYYGNVSLREALARSLNAPAVRLAEDIGRAKGVAVARRLGLTSSMPDGPSVSLGAGAASLIEITSAYAALAAGGRFTPPHGVVEVKSRDGTVLYDPSFAATNAVAPEVVHRMNDMLSAVIAWGSGKAAQVGRDAAGKTGTSQRGRDGWFIGYTADLAVGVWVGNDNDTPVPGLTGSGLPARIWRAFVAGTHNRYQPKPLPGLRGYAARRGAPKPAPIALPALSTDAGSPTFAPKPKPYVEYKYPEDDDRP